MERNILLTIEYDGSGFHGWQRQPEVRTVQGELERVLSHICGMPVAINGTSRTDAGVHALGQRASFRGDFGIPTDRIALAANNLLAGGMNSQQAVGDVRIIKAEDVPDGFHARFNSRGKMYRYIIRNCPEVDIFRRNYCYQVRQPLDLDVMRQAAAYIEGTHDFKCFQAAGGQEKETTVRTIHSLIIRREAENVIKKLATDEPYENSSWNRRFRENSEKIRSGNIYLVASVVRSLTIRERERGLSTGEKKMLSDSRQILISELVLSLDKTKEEVSEMIEKSIFG